MSQISPNYLFAFVAAAVVGFLGMLANAIIVYSIFHYKTLTTIPNIFLANWSIADFLSIISIPIFTAIYVMLSPHEPYAYSCFSVQAIIILHVVVLWFGILLSIDWLAAVYCIRISGKLRRCYCAVVTFIWIAAFLLYLLCASLCLSDVYYYVSVVLFFIFYAISQLFAIMLESHTIMNRSKINSTSYQSSIQTRLLVITVILCSYLTGVIFLVLEYLNIFKSIYDDVFKRFCVFVSVLPIFCRSVIGLGILYYLDGDFRSCLLPVFVKTFRSKICRVSD